MWPWVPKKLLKWEKAKKHTFFLKLNFLTAPARSCCRCGQFKIQFVFDDLQHLLISLARGIKFLYNVELLYPLDEFQTNLIFYRGNIKQKHHFYCVADKIKAMFLFYVSLLKTKFVSNLSDAFAVILPQQRPVLVSAHAQNFFSWSLPKKTLQGNANCSAPKTVKGVTNVANGR